MTRAANLHVLIATIGSAGDVDPFLAVGRELKRRGHNVTLITSSFFELRARNAGLDFVGLGTPEDYKQTIDDPDLWDPSKGLHIFARHVLTPTIRPLYEILTARLQSSTIVVAQGQAFGAHLAHEKHGVPFITIHLQPAAFRSIQDAPLMPGWMPPSIRSVAYRLVDHFVLDRELAPDLNAFRSHLGLPEVHNILGSWVHSPQKTIGLFPDWFAAPQPDWPPQTDLTGFVFLDEGHQPLEPSLSSLLAEGEPPIVFTPGTAMRHADQFFETSVRASLELGRRALLLTQFPEQLPTRLPPGIATFSYAPFVTLLPRAAAVVHHGGIGTVAQSLAAGIPQLVRPMAFDQPDNAARVERLGVGLTVRPGSYTVKNVARKLDGLLNSKHVRARCRAYSARMQPGSSLAAVCDAVEHHGRLA